MKQLVFFLATMLAFSACTNKGDDAIEQVLPPTSIEDGMYTYIMTMNEDAKPVIDDSQTRATVSGAWENRDTICIYFGGSNSAYAEGVYDLEHNTWNVTTPKSLIKTTNDICTIAYYKGINKHKNIKDEKWAYYDYLTDWYSTESGNYTYDGNEIRISAKLTRPYWRIRFKGEPGTEIRIDSTGILHAIETYRFDNKWSGAPLCLKVNSDGFTNYFIGYADLDCKSIKIDNANQLLLFERYFDDHSLSSGESGCFSIPDSENLHGWTKSSNYDYVDLGLPSGLLWATRNVGAYHQYSSGNYYAWGEIEEKETYTKENYLYKSEDVATIKWGPEWRIPVTDDIQELRKYCHCSSIFINDINIGVLCTSSINGKTLFLPNTDSKGDYNPNHESYWTKTLYTSSAGIECAYSILTLGEIYGGSGSRKTNGMTIRPVKSK